MKTTAAGTMVSAYQQGMNLTVVSATRATKAGSSVKQVLHEDLYFATQKSGTL